MYLPEELYNERTSNYQQPRAQLKIQKCDVTLPWEQNFWILTKNFQTETAICIVELWKKSMSCHFVLVRNWARGSVTVSSVSFFLLYLKDLKFYHLRNETQRLPLYIPIISNFLTYVTGHYAIHCSIKWFHQREKKHDKLWPFFDNKAA